MEGQLTLRRALRKDGQALYELRYLAYLRPYALYSPKNSPCLQSLEEFLKTLEDEEKETCSLYIGSRLVGGAVLKPRDKDVVIEELYVDPALQGRGIGAQALHLLEAKAPSAHYRMELPGNEAKGLFYQAGYRAKGEPAQMHERCRIYNWEKEAYKQVEILLGPLKREALPAVERMCRNLDEKRLYDFSGGLFNTAPSVETLSDLFGAGKHHAGASRLDYAIEAPEYGAVIGLISLTELEWEVRRGQVAHLLIDERWRGVGLGRQAVESVCRAAYEKYGFRGLTANLLEDNEWALKCLDSAGFKVALRREGAYPVEGGEALDSLALMRRHSDVLDEVEEEG